MLNTPNLAQTLARQRVYLYLLTLVLPFWTWICIGFFTAVDFRIVFWSLLEVASQRTPYGAEATARLMSMPIDNIFIGTGSGYPLPFYILILPLAWLPEALAIALWTVLGALLLWPLFRLRPYPIAYTLLLLLLYLPLQRGIVAAQPTFVYFGLTALLVLSIEQKNYWLIGLLIPILVLKPQNGALFALYAALWSLWNERRALLIAACFGLFLFATSYFWQPSWFWEWLEQLKTYQDVTKMPNLFWYGLPLLVLAWRMPWYVMLSLLQVFLFPLTDLYSFTPLLLVWFVLGGKLALFGTGISWLWLFLGLPNSVQVALALLIVPLGAAIVWRRFGVQLLSHPSIRQRLPWLPAFDSHDQQALQQAGE
jgi:Protein of unknown function (DUF2029).